MPPKSLLSLANRSPSRRLQALASFLVLQWPAAALAFALADAQIAPAKILISWFFFVAATVAVVALTRQFAGRNAAIVLTLSLSIYATLCTALATYRLYSHDWLDVSVLVGMPVESVRTAILIFGGAGLSSAVVILAAHTLLFALATGVFVRSLAAEARTGLRHPGVLLALAAVLVWAGVPHAELLVDYQIARRVAGIVPLRPAGVDRVALEEPVFLIQLESLNALAVNGEYDVAGTEDAIPVMRRLASHGVLFTHVWSHDVLTHRAQQGFLCGAVRNLSADAFYEQIRYEGDCIPALLRNAGYRTVFLKGYPNAEFAKAGILMERFGYSDRHFGDLMKRGDRADLWGYDERTFFTRSFEYLQRTYRSPDRLFVHLAVSAHHVGFARTGKSDSSWFLKSHAEQLAAYLRSARVQDASLDTLWTHLERFTGGNAHVFIFGDHSYPLGLYGSTQPTRGSTVDNFLTTMLYIPPRSRAAHFALGRTIDDLHALSDLPPTLAELTSGKPAMNSLVPFMLKDPPPHPPYEQCHIMTQPFGYRAVVIANGRRLHTYTFADRCVEELEILDPPSMTRRLSRTCKVAFDDFDRQYRCGRYQTSPPGGRR